MLSSTRFPTISRGNVRLSIRSDKFLDEAMTLRGGSTDLLYRSVAICSVELVDWVVDFCSEFVDLSNGDLELGGRDSS